jgi:hypothetical protein
MEKDFQINISSPPDRERLVSEIMVNHVQWAEINQETGDLRVEFYPRPDAKPWNFSLEEAMEALVDAKKALIESRSGRSAFFPDV